MDTQAAQREGENAAAEVGAVPISGPTSGPISGPVVVRRSRQGWQVGPEETADLTSAMVLADLLAADLGSPVPPPAGPTLPPRQ
jgi:hypothetical protein